MPYNFGQGVGLTGSRALQGAEIGSIIPGIGTGIGAAIGGGVGLLESLFGSTPEDEYQKRKQELLASIQAYRQQDLADIYGRTNVQLGESREAAGRRAAALGRSGDAEAFQLPIAQQVTRTGADAMRDVNQYYRNQEMGVEQSFADRPIQPGISDYLTGIGQGATQFLGAKQAIKSQGEFNQQYLDILRQYGWGAQTINQGGGFGGSGGFRNPIFH